MPDTTLPITADERAMAAITHLSGLAGYIIPLGGVIVPIVIWLTRRDSPAISSIAKQAVLLNLFVFTLIVASAVLWVTLILIPLVVLFWIGLGIAAVVLPDRRRRQGQPGHLLSLPRDRHSAGLELAAGTGAATSRFLRIWTSRPPSANATSSINSLIR